MLADRYIFTRIYLNFKCRIVVDREKNNSLLEPSRNSPSLIVQSDPLNVSQKEIFRSPFRKC